MARNIENVLTAQGARLITRSLAEGKAILFTGAKLGTGLAPDDADPTKYTALLTPYDDAEVAGRKVDTSGNLIISVQFWNTRVLASTLIEEIGLYAKLDGDADAVLFSYLTFGQYPDLILAAAQSSVQRTYDVPFIFGDGTAVSVTITPSALLPALDAVSTAQAGKLLRLNADAKLPCDITGDALTLGGHGAAYFAKADHRHENATSKQDGFMSKDDKAALDTLNKRVTQSLTSESRPTFAGLVVDGYIDNARFR